MKVFLIGLPASGKTTIGLELSSILDLAFIDLDREVEREEGMSIQRIFEEHSEDHFRKTETGILKKYCDGPSEFVMATGGGTPCFFDNIDMMNRAGKSVFLDVPVPILAQRMKLTTLSIRPLFAHTKPEGIQDQLQRMRSQRLPYYVRSLATVSGENIKSSEVLEVIKKESRM